MLKAKIQSDQIDALKKGNKKRLEVLRYILAQIKYAEIDKKADLTDDEVVAVLRKQMKEVRDSIDGYDKGGRDDLVREEKEKMEIISSYVPQEMSDEELRKELQRIIDSNKEVYETRPRSVIGIAIKELKDKVDSSRVSSFFQKEFTV